MPPQWACHFCGVSKLLLNRYLIAKGCHMHLGLGCPPAKECQRRRYQMERCCVVGNNFFLCPFVNPAILLNGGKIASMYTMRGALESTNPWQPTNTPMTRLFVIIWKELVPTNTCIYITKESVPFNTRLFLVLGVRLLL